MGEKGKYGYQGRSGGWRESCKRGTGYSFPLPPPPLKKKREDSRLVSSSRTGGGKGVRIGFHSLTTGEEKGGGGKRWEERRYCCIGARKR